MKSTFRQFCCLILVASLLFQAVPMAMAQVCRPSGPMAAIYTELLEARRILSIDAGAKASQDGIIPLDRAKRLVSARDFSKTHSALASDLLRGIEKARLKVLWNDRNEALMIVNRLLGLLDDYAKKPIPQTPCGNGPGAATAFGAAVVAGLGALFVAIMFGFGQVSHR